MLVNIKTNVVSNVFCWQNGKLRDVQYFGRPALAMLRMSRPRSAAQMTTLQQPSARHGPVGSQQHLQR